MKKIIQYYKQLPANEWKELRKNISVPEYIFWWLIRGLMLYAVIVSCKEYAAEEQSFIILLQLSVNFAVTFLVTLLRFVFPKQLFLGRVPYTVQKYAMVIVFFGSFIGHYFDKCAVAGYDSFLHILSGFLLVFVCYEIVMSMQLQNRPVSGFIASVIGFGMNCFVIILWEIFEFVMDYIGGGNLQMYDPPQPDSDYFLFRLLGMPVAMEQIHVFDTMIDIVLALVSSIPAAVLLWVLIARKNKKAALQQAETEMPVPVA